MAGNEIKIIIGGDPSGFKSAARESAMATERLRTTLKDATAVMPAFNTAASKTGDALKNKVEPGAKSAGSAILGLSRVVQDAPFGFAGIANNLTELPGQFNALSAAAKDSGQSVKSLLLTSLLGPAGLGVALSLVTSAITFATVGFGAWTRGFGGADAAIDKTKKEIDDFIKSMRSVDAAIGEATASQEGQITRVQALASAVSDSNKPYEQRKRALEELKSINKAYFEDLKLEDAATGKLTKTVTEYTNALINSAIQKEFTEDIAKIAKEVSKQDGIIANARMKVAQAQTEVNKAQERTKGSFTEEQISANAAAGAAAINKLKDAQENLGKENTKVTELLTQEALVRGQLNKAVEEGLKFKDLETHTDKKAEDLLKKRLEALEKIKSATKDATQLVGIQEAIFELQVKIAIRDKGKNQLSQTELDQQIKGFQDELNDAFKKQAIELEALPKIKFSNVARIDTSDIINKSFTSKLSIKPTIEVDGVNVEFKKESVDVTDLKDRISKATGLDKKITLPTQFDIDLQFNGREFAESAELARQQAEGVQKALFEGIKNGMIEGSAILGEALAEVLNGGNIGSLIAAAAQQMLAIIGGVLQEVGKQIILASALVASLKKALKALFAPGGEAIGFAVGAALVATGALLKSIKFDVPQLAQGGIATGPTLGIFGEAGKEAIIPLDRLPELLGRINVNNQNDVALAPTFRVSLTDLELGLERVRSSRRRLG